MHQPPSMQGRAAADGACVLARFVTRCLCISMHEAVLGLPMFQPQTTLARRGRAAADGAPGRGAQAAPGAAAGKQVAGQPRVYCRGAGGPGRQAAGRAHHQRRPVADPGYALRGL